MINTALWLALGALWTLAFVALAYLCGYHHGVADGWNAQARFIRRNHLGEVPTPIEERPDWATKHQRV